MQEPVYVLHLITCHGRIMPRLAELLFYAVTISIFFPPRVYLHHLSVCLVCRYFGQIVNQFQKNFIHILPENK